MKTKSDIVIKVLSLGVGLAVGIVLIAKVFFELSYDSFYKNVDLVYRIQSTYVMNDEPGEYGQVSGGVTTGFMNEVPGVQYATRTTFRFNKNIYLDEDKNKLEAYLVCADTCFFKVFDRPILAGDPVKTLGKWDGVMVSHSFAKKLLRSADDDISSVIGKQICNEEVIPFKMPIGGVYEDFPENGTLSFDILLSMENMPTYSTENWLGNDRYRGYVKLYPGVDPHSLKDAIRKMQEAHQPLVEYEAKGMTLAYSLKPFSSLHTSDPYVKTQIILLSVVAVLLILISLLNYILIVISSLVKRSKEVGVRKCYGAGSYHIYGLLSKESLLHIVLSLVIAGIIIFAGRDIIENLLGVPFETLLVTKSVIAISLLILFVLIVSIVVPAELYQRIPIYAALKNYTEHSRKWKLGLLGIQVLINVFLVVMLLIIARQYNMVTNSNPGYDYKNLYSFSMFDGDVSARARAVETLKSLPEVKGVAAVYNIPYDGPSGDLVYLPGDDRELFNFADQYESSEDFFDLMGIEFVDGREPRDSSEVVVDETFVAKMSTFTDWSDGAIGKQIFVTGHSHAMEGITPYTISGVYKKYLLGNLLDPDTRPSAMFHGEIGSKNSWMPHILFRVNPDSLDKVREALSKVLEGRDINLVSYEEEMRAAYASGKRMRNTMAIGALFSLFIALLGLIGFIKDESLRRSKEMAVRKINGATTRDILGVFAKDIMKLSVVMSILASVGALFVVRKWLEQFAEKVALSPIYFICGSVLVLLIVLGVVVLNCLHIAHSNPVDSLKNE